MRRKTAINGLCVALALTVSTQVTPIASAANTYPYTYEEDDEEIKGELSSQITLLTAMMALSVVAIAAPFVVMDQFFRFMGNHRIIPDLYFRQTLHL